MSTHLNQRAAVRVFVVFAFAYFISTLIRAITATLAPILTLELSLQASDLGLLAGGYFLGFAAMQLPLGSWLDRYGPKSVILCFLCVAALGCVAFALATSFYGLLAARVLCGAGLGACLMAPLTGYRRWFAASLQLRANSWMLMTGSLGMLASTLPVQWLVPVLGWRVLFWILAVLVLLAIGLIAGTVPAWAKSMAPVGAVVDGGYAEVWRHPYFRRLMPMGFFIYGGMVALQTLWAGPWMVKVVGFSALQAATGLFTINVVMLCTYWAWGALSPWLARRGLGANRLMACGLPISFVALAIVIEAGSAISTGAAAVFSVFFMGCSFVSLSQPALALAFPSALAGRALSAFNLVLFAGVFAVQWGIGLGVDGFKAMGFSEVAAFQAAMSVFLLCCIASYIWFLVHKDHAATHA
jgi:MFS family permease